MKIALIGHGAMGQLVASGARKAGDDVGIIIASGDSVQDADRLSEKLRGHDVAIDFSVAAAVLNSIEACARASVPLVEGTTGWNDHLSDARRIIERQGGSLVYGANFSIGVNIFYRIVERAATLFAAVDEYAAFIEEAHHSRKRDAPSGTALRLQEVMSKHLGNEIPTSSTRAGYIPGTHRVGFDSVADQIMLTHEARSRQGFAAGALLAAHWIIGRTGIYEFSEVMEEILN
jgi:4-hydroxy-tetrahydrodipicolinate reductase